MFEGDVADARGVCPAGLRPGDTVAVVAPASQIKSGQESALGRGLTWLREQGWIPRLMPYAGERSAELPYLAGCDEARVADLHAAFSDPEARAVWCVRGGYGTPRLLPGLDLELIAGHPKIFVGFSDVTAIHVVLNQRLGWITFHGPMVASNLGQDAWQSSEWAVASLLDCVGAGRGAPGAISRGDPARQGKAVVAGVAEGPTIGGNAALIGALLGTPHGLDDTPGRLLLLEEVDEAPYRLDRLLTQLRLGLKLQAVKGIAIGQITGLSAADRAVVEHLVQDRLGDLGVPVVMDLPFGHDNPTACVPLGAWARLEARADGTGDLIFSEAVVKGG